MGDACYSRWPSSPFIIGPLEVLLPFAIRDNLGGGAEDYGLALAAFGVGGAVGALAISSGGYRAAISRS